MPRKLTPEIIIGRTKTANGGRFIIDYDKLLSYYESVDSRFPYICPKHGEKWITFKDFWTGYGCRECGIESASEKRATPKEAFIKKASKRLKNIEFINLPDRIAGSDTVTIRCILCNKIYTTKAHTVMYSPGKAGSCMCQQKKVKQITVEYIIEKCKKAHGDLYDYSLITDDVIKKRKDRMFPIICRKHGVFIQNINNHIRGSGCPYCSKRARYTKETFSIAANAIHNNKYSYDKVVYITNKDKVIITCPIHGDFLQRPDDHLKGRGCWECSGIKPFSEVEYIEKAKMVWGDQYIYSNIGFRGMKKPITVICQKHGEFSVIATNHLSGAGCPICSHNGFSKQEHGLADYIESLGLDVVRNQKIEGVEIDIFIPSKGIGIEYNGIYWHSESRGKDKNYHLNKTKHVESLGYRLIHIWDVDYTNKPDIVKSIISSKLGFYENRVYARKCNVNIINTREANQFFGEHHIQGQASISKAYGLYYNNELIGVAGFAKTNARNKTTAEWDMKRLCFKKGWHIVGGAGKLLKVFIKDVNPVSIVTYADRMISNGDVYETLGFERVKITYPDYKYQKGGELFNKQMFTKDKIKKKFGLSGKTEREMMAELGYSRIWDCGKYVYVLGNI